MNKDKANNMKEIFYFCNFTKINWNHSRFFAMILTLNDSRSSYENFTIY